MKITWIDRAKARMRALGVSQETLAHALGCTRGAVGHYLAGRRNPTLNQLEMIADVLQLDPRWLLFGDDRTGIGEAQLAYREVGSRNPCYPWVPISGTTETGYGRQLLGQLDLSAHCSSAYALVVTGTTWAPRFHDGEIILLCPEREPVPGDELWVRYLDGQMGLQVLIRIQGDQVILDSLTDHRQRQLKSRKDIEYMHPIVAVFRSSAANELVATGR